MPKSLGELNEAALSPKKKDSAAPKRETSVLRDLLSFDRQLRKAHGVNLLVGLDEVGRGCLAGPVVAAAAILPPIGKKLAQLLALLNDSKKVSPDNRFLLAQALREAAQWSIGSASVEEIDELNIYHASLLAMRRALDGLLLEITFLEDAPLVVLDGNVKIPEISIDQLPIIKGDTQSASIAAASIIAKVHRDTLMHELAAEIPHYHWANNKGYGTSAHIEAIRTHGICLWHRRTFMRKFAMVITDGLTVAP